MKGLAAGQMDGSSFGLLALGNAINDGRQAWTDDKGPPARAYELRIGERQLRLTAGARALGDLAYTKVT